VKLSVLNNRRQYQYERHAQKKLPEVVYRRESQPSDLDIEEYRKMLERLEMWRLKILDEMRK